MTTLFQLAFAVSICSKNRNHNLDLQFLPFINILKIRQINLLILATVVEVIVTLPADLPATIANTLAPFPVPIPVLASILEPLLEHIRPITIVIDLDMTNITIIIPINHILLQAHIITLIPPVAHLNITLVLVTVPQTLTPQPFTNTILLIVLPLNHEMIVTVVDPIQIHTTVLNSNINHL